LENVTNESAAVESALRRFSAIAVFDADQPEREPPQVLRALPDAFGRAGGLIERRARE
jgi:hypothetical protein